MDNKYYTPTIEEFHVGFDCELFHQYSESEDHFDKEIYDELTPVWWNRTMDELIRNKEVRVKYLDKEDIESLGWKLKGEEIKKAPYKSHFCTFIKDKNELHIQLENVNGYYPNKLTMRGDYLNINPLIKNKSELKRLMKQLGIYE